MPQLLVLLQPAESQLVRPLASKLCQPLASLVSATQMRQAWMLQQPPALWTPLALLGWLSPTPQVLLQPPASSAHRSTRSRVW